MKRPITRRTMISQSTAMFTGLCLCGRGVSAEKPTTGCCGAADLETESYVIGDHRILVDLSKAPSLARVGSAAHLVNPEKKLQLIIVHSAPDQFVALHRLCTHGGQTISYNHRRGVLQCNNHNHAIFDLTGQVVKGPAPKPLAYYPIALYDAQLEISLHPHASPEVSA